MNEYRFLKDYDAFKAGDVAEIDEATAKVLLKTGTIAVVDAKADEAYDKQMKGFENIVAEQVKKALASVPQTDHPNVKILVEVTKDEGDKGFASFGEQVKAIIKAETPGGAMDPRLKAAASGMNETVGAEGGYLVQSDFSQEMIKRAFGQSVLAPLTSGITLGANTNSLYWNERKDYDQQDANRNVQVYWTDEAGLMTASKGKFERQSLALEKLTGLYYATDESLQDAQSLEMLVDEWFQEEFSFKLDQAILRGDGVGKPLGILKAACLVSQAAEGSQTADTINAANVAKMYSRMWAPSIGNSAWFVNQEILPQLMLLTLTTLGVEAPLWMPPTSGFQGAPGGLLLGRPVRFLDHCSTLGDEGDILLADMSKYRMISKGGLAKDASIHVRFLYNETAFRFVMRINGQPVWSTVVTPSQATTHTRSPFVTLAAR